MSKTACPYVFGTITSEREYFRMLSMMRRDGFSSLTVFFFKGVEVISISNELVFFAIYPTLTKPRPKYYILRLFFLKKTKTRINILIMSQIQCVDFYDLNMK